MWLGALSIAQRGARAEAACEAFDDYRHFANDELPATTQDELARVGRMVFQGRLGVILFTWLSITATYLLIRSLWGAEIAVLSLILIALDPFYLGLSRFLHTDAVLTSLMTLSLLSLLASMRRRAFNSQRVTLLLVSGAAGGLAAFQKTPAGFLVPFVVLLLSVDLIRRRPSREGLSRAMRALVLWGLAAAIAYAGAWPAMWSDPVGTVRKVLGMATRYAVEGHTPGNYFLGEPVHDPGWLFYPVAALFRLSPLVLVGIVASLVRFGTEGIDERHSFDLLALLSYSALFAFFISLGDKMFDRYLLPVFPALAIAAAAGLLWSVKALWTWVQRRVRGLPSGFPTRYAVGAVVMVTLAVQAAMLFLHHPYYITYYNPLLGGPRQAQRALLMGWGEGYDQVAAYLNQKPNAQQLHVTTPTTAAFAPLFDGETWPMDRYFAWQSDYVVFYISDVQRRQEEDLLQNYLFDPSREPDRVISLHGVDYVWIYHNDYEGALEYVEQHSQPEEGECLLTNGKTLFAKHYDGDLPLYTFSPEYQPDSRSYTYWDRERMSQFLDGMFADCNRIWYPRYPEGEGDHYVDLLEVRGALMDQASFSDIEVTLHRLVEPETASQELDLRFGDLRLRRYGVTDPPPAWGRDGGLVLEWEALEPLREDYTVYLHLYDAHGRRIAQGDSLIVDRISEPTSQWETGVAKPALYHLPIPPDAPPGQYQLELGVYDLETGERLPLLGAEDASRETAVRLPMTVGSPDQMPEVADLGVPHLLEHPLTRNLELVGYELEHQAIFAGNGVGIRLFWQAHGSMDQDYRLQLTLEGEDEVIYGQQAFDPTSTDYPTSRWRPDELLGEWYYVPTREDVPTGAATLKLDLLDVRGRSVLTRPIEISNLWIQSTKPSFDAPSDLQRPVYVALGDRITLLGGELDHVVRPGETIAVTLYWKAQQEIGTDYKVFVHLYDGEGGILAQRDRHPGLGTRPTTTWERGEVVADRYSIPTPSDAPIGNYELGVGMYDPQSGERLAALGPDGDRLPHNRVILGSVEIEH